MTKGDIFKTEQDCNKCMVQITSALSSILPPQHGFEIPIIYIPDEVLQNPKKPRKLPDNQIYDLCDTIDKKLDIKVQTNLATFKHDIQTLTESVK